MDSSMPSDDEQLRDPIPKRDVDPTDSERLQLYGYSHKHSKATQKIREPGSGIGGLGGSIGGHTGIGDYGGLWCILE